MHTIAVLSSTSTKFRKKYLQLLVRVWYSCTSTLFVPVPVPSQVLILLLQYHYRYTRGKTTEALYLVRVVLSSVLQRCYCTGPRSCTGTAVAHVPERARHLL